MFIIYGTETNVVFAFTEKAVYARPDEDVHGLVPCERSESIYTWDISSNLAYSKNYTDIAEVPSIPGEWIVDKYLYKDGEVIVNPDWVEPEPYVPIEETVANHTKSINELEIENAELKATIEEQNEVISELNDTLLEVLLG